MDSAMIRRCCVPAAVAILVLGADAVTTADVGLGYYCNPEPTTTEPVSLCCLPDGSGDRLDDCQLFGGSRIDATLRVTMVNENGTPVAFAAERLALAPDAYGAPTGPTYCLPLHPETDCDPTGRTAFSGAAAAGGHHRATVGEHVAVLVDGGLVYDPPQLQISYNSPDIDGDLRVDLTDVILFGQDYFGAYDYRSDFHWDGQINLSDLVLLSGGLGVRCD
jgi:hypothetical protein